MMRSQKWLLAICGILLLLAVIGSRISLPERASIIFGLIEIILAALLGISIGLLSVRRAAAKRDAPDEP